MINNMSYFLSIYRRFPWGELLTTIQLKACTLYISYEFY